MSRNFKHRNAISLILLTTALIVTIFSQSLSIVSAQTTDATVVILPTTGGTTSPAAGTYTYPNGTMITLSATASAGYTFQYWVVSGNVTPGHETPSPVYIYDPDTGAIIGEIPRAALPTGIDSLVFTANPANITCGYGYEYSYQAVFTPTGSTPTGNNATVIIMPTVGGTVSPAPGMYSYTNGTVITFSATANSGYVFSYWLVTGDFTQGHTPASYTYIADDNGNIIAQIPRTSASPGLDSLAFTTNPASVTCGYGYTYTYTAFFTPVSTVPSPVVTATPTPVAATPTPTQAPTQAPTPTPAPTAAPSGDMTTTIIIAVVVIVIIIIIVIAALMMRRKK